MMATTANTPRDVSPLAQFLLSMWPRWTAKEAGRAIGVSHRTVENWLQGRRQPSWISRMEIYRLIQRAEAGREQFERARALGEKMREDLAAAALARDLLDTREPLAGQGEPGSGLGSGLDAPRPKR